MSEKTALTDYPVHELIAERWSPYGFAEREVSPQDLCSLFEAARWAASSYNEQPWSFIVATKADAREYERVLSCLVEANQVWAKAAPALALGVISKKFKRNNKDNTKAAHDLGLAVGNLVLEATSRGIYAHQMGGILPEKAHEIYQLPGDVEVHTGIAIGYKADPATLPDQIKSMDTAPRQRKPVTEFVFTGKWGVTSPLVRK